MELKDIVKKKENSRTQVVQARISRQIILDLNPYMRKNDLKISDMIKASLEMLVEKVKDVK